MLKNKKLIAILVVVLLGGGAAYSMAKPKLAVKQKIQGTIYVLPQSFLLNLNDGHFAKLTLALILAPGQSDGAAAGAAASSSSEGGPGTLPEEAVIRDIVTNLMTNESSGELTTESGRRAAKRQILAAIRQQTDIKVEQVLFPDLTVQ
jgi:flagellar basal body-associated protein FliL